MNSATIVQKLWNYCNARKGVGGVCEIRLALRDYGLSYGDYVEQ